MDTSPTSTHLGFRERWITTGILGLGLIVFAINGSTTHFVLPKIMTNLRVELYQIHWVITAPGIMRTVIIPTLGWLSGRLGPRALYLCSIGIFGAGTLGSALAWDWPSLIAFRVLTGVGGGLIAPLSMAIFYQIFPPVQRGMALGFSLLGWSIGPSVGPLMGGYLLQFASWRAIYVMLLPLVGTGFLCAWWFLPRLQRPERRRLDQFGLLSMAVAVSTFILALSWGHREGWDSQDILMLLAVAGTAAVVFIVIELRHPEPLVALRLFRHLPFVMTIVVMFMTTMAFRSTGPMMPVLMQRLLGFAPLRVAWTMLPASIVNGCAVLLAGRLSDRLSPQVLVIAGLALYATTFASYAGINELTTPLMMTTFLCFRQIAEGCITGPNNLTALRALPEDRVMMAAGLMGLVRSIANILGTSSAAVLWDARYGRHIQHYVENAPVEAFGLTVALREVQSLLGWMGELATQIPSMALAVVHRRLLAEASTAAWQDYLLYNALIALLAMIPALFVSSHLWRRSRAADAPVEAVEASAPSPTGDAGSRRNV